MFIIRLGQSFNQSSFKLLVLPLGASRTKSVGVDQLAMSLGASLTKSVGADQLAVEIGQHRQTKPEERCLHTLFPTSRGTSRSVKDVQTVVNLQNRGSSFLRVNGRLLVPGVGKKGETGQIKRLNFWNLRKSRAKDSWKNYCERNG